jgi:hypothetical protein
MAGTSNIKRHSLQSHAPSQNRTHFPPTNKEEPLVTNELPVTAAQFGIRRCRSKRAAMEQELTNELTLLRLQLPLLTF